MNFTEFEKPTLIEPGVKYFLIESLKQCKEFKNKYKNIMFNIAMCVLFFLILGGILIYKYRGKLTPSEKEIKNKEKQQYVLSKIKNYQDAKLLSEQSLITGLPQWDNEYDILHKKI
jgi:hypothetical protein